MINLLLQDILVKLSFRNMSDSERQEDKNSDEKQADRSSDDLLLGSMDDDDVDLEGVNLNDTLHQLLSEENEESDKISTDDTIQDPNVIFPEAQLDHDVASSSDVNVNSSPSKDDDNIDNSNKTANGPTETDSNAHDAVAGPSGVNPSASAPSCSSAGVTSYSKRSRSNLDVTEVITRRNNKTKRMFYFAIDEGNENHKFVSNLNSVLQDLKNMRLNLEDLRIRIFSGEIDNIIYEIKSLVASIRASITLYNYYIDKTPQSFYNEMTLAYDNKFMDIYTRYRHMQDAMEAVRYRSDDSDVGEIDCTDNIVIENIPSDFDIETTDEATEDNILENKDTVHDDHNDDNTDKDDKSNV